MRGATQVLSDCPHCRVESALVELIDPTERVGVAIEGRCRLCGYATDLGEVTRLGHPFVDADEVIAALAGWAAADGEPDVRVFAVANFNGRDPAAIARAVLAGERVDTGFDVIAWLFPGLQGGGRRGDEEERPTPKFGPAPESRRTIPFERPGGPGGTPPGGGVEPHGSSPGRPSSARGTEEPQPGARRGPPQGGPTAPPPAARCPEPTPAAPVAAHGAPEVNPHDIARALASVMLADGRIRPAERRFLDETLARMGAPPLEDADLRVWRPFELGPVPDPKGLLHAMRLLALCDHEADGSERRVLEEFARAWRVPLPADVLPRQGAMAELGRALRGLLAW